MEGQRESGISVRRFEEGVRQQDLLLQPHTGQDQAQLTRDSSSDSRLATDRHRRFNESPDTSGRRTADDVELGRGPKRYNYRVKMPNDSLCREKAPHWVTLLSSPALVLVEEILVAQSPLFRIFVLSMY